MYFFILVSFYHLFQSILLFFLGLRGSGGQDHRQARVRTDVFPRDPAEQRIVGSLLLSSVSASQARPSGRRRQLSGESVVRVRTWLFCRVFYEASRQPRHATSTSICPVESFRPRLDRVRVKTPLTGHSRANYTPFSAGWQWVGMDSWRHEWHE